MKKYIIGALVGSALTLSASVGAEAIKQYILTEVAYPVVVNGKEFKDPAAPILNYEGSTYVPLAKLGDITGVNYKWNDTAKRVEIVTGSGAAATSESGFNEKVVYNHDLHPEAAGSVTGGTPSGGTLTGDTVIVKPKGLVVENGETVFYAYDRDDKFKGRFTDSDNAELTIAIIDKRATLPPKTSEGWIDLGILSKIHNDADIKFENNTLILKTSPTFAKQVEYLRINLPEGWKDKESDILTEIGVKVKVYKFDKYNYGEWINDDELKRKTGVSLGYDVSKQSNGTVYQFYTQDSNYKNTIIHEMTVPQSGVKPGEKKLIDGVTMYNSGSQTLFSVDDLKKLKVIKPAFEYLLYFNIADLQKVGILK